MSPLSRRLLLRGACAACACGGLAHAVLAQTGPFPAKPMVVKMAFPAGGPADVSIRAAAVVLQQSLGQPLVVDSMPGANGSLSAAFVARTKPDGYTLLGTTGIDFLVAPMTIASAKYDPVAFKLLGVAGISDFVLVSSAAHQFKSRLPRDWPRTSTSISVPGIWARASVAARSRPCPAMSLGFRAPHRWRLTRVCAP